MKNSILELINFGKVIIDLTMRKRWRIVMYVFQLARIALGSISSFPIESNSQKRLFEAFWQGCKKADILLKAVMNRH